MKVKELYIKKYHQFEDFKLDLTYPEGHKKAGQPLDKVCFIGQSGTGKTSLLDLIKYYLHTRTSIKIEYKIIEQGEYSITQKLDYDTINSKFDIKLSIVDFVKGIKTKELTTPLYLQEDVEINNDYFKAHFSFKNFMFLNDNDLIDPMSVYDNHLKSQYPLIISYPADISFKEFDANSVIDTSIQELREIDVSVFNLNYLWTEINKELISYREKEISERVSMSEKIQSSLSNKDEIFKAVEYFEKWQKENINPIIGLAELLDKILNKFNLQVRTKLDFQKTEDISTIKIETLQGGEILNAFLSTGTKQFILTTLPLYSSKPKNAVVLFDEPERSLYPDIQKEIVDIYTSLTTDCQFFYATHSPIIASSFEPWEIVELKFNPKTGTVFQELYYEEEKGRHVDNYTINPQYLRWDDILQRVFDLDSEGNEKRVKALMKLATLESKLKKNNITSEEREKLWQEYLKLSKLTGWTTRMTNEKN